MKRSPVEKYARTVPQAKTDSVRSASVQKTASRLTALAKSFEDSEAARSQAAAIKDYVLNNLRQLQIQLIAKCEENGIRVHQAKDGKEANRIILDIVKAAAPGGGVIAKAKSMATEEIHLNEYLEKAGYEPVETDLGEYVVQIDHDHPSHIVTPIIHKNRREIARSFAREGLGEYTEDASELAMQARAHLRAKFREAKVGVSGVNFAIAESGRIVLVENEGNNRLSTTAPDVHIAVMGIEKMLPAEKDLPLFLKLLAGSATGQSLTSYTHLISGPRREDELDGPLEVHLVLLDNGRSNVLEGPYKEILRCIRCGACLNVCPVYRQASGHAYGHVYSGPLGAVLAPALEGVEKLGYLAKASTLCGACEEVCPVKIPIPNLLLKLRDEATRKGAIKDPAQWNLFATGANMPSAWKVGLKMLPMASAVAPHPMKSGWNEFHSLPHRQGRSFRSWWKNHQAAVEEPPAEHTPHDSAPLPETSATPDLWGSFEEKLVALGGTYKSLEEVDLSEKICIYDADAITCAKGIRVAGVTGDVWQADAGITLADFAIAETGSIVISAGSGRARLASLAPPVHVCLLKEIVPTLQDALDRMTPRTSVIVTGTSRTADIEGVLVRGVHGPRELIVVRLP